MNLIPLRTAVIAGTCAVALSFVAVPAFADVDPLTGVDSTTQTDPTPTDSASTDSSATAPTDDSTTNDSSDDSGDVADDNGDDSSTDDSGTTAAPVALPAEKGTPKQHFADTVLTPKQIARKGITVEYTGLTAGATYQPYYSTGQSGGELGTVKKASKKGMIHFTYKLDKSEKKSFGKLGAVYTVGLLGQDTDLRLTQEISVKYDSDLSWKPAERHGATVTLSVSVDKDDAAGESGDWKKAKVDFQKKVGAKWVTVRTVKTDAAGVASTTVKSSKKSWRAVLETSRSVIGATSRGHKA